MKIIGVSAVPMSAPVPPEKRHRTDLGTKVKTDATLIRVQTDNGLTGIGAALGTPPIVAAIVEHELAPECAGEDPMFSERIYEKMYNGSRSRPALERGAWVISDRFADSTRAYQGWGHGLDLATLDRVYDVAVGVFRPDLTLILDLPVDTGLARAASRRGAETRYESLPRAFHERVREGFLTIARNEPERCAVIDASQDIDAVAAAIARVVADRLGA